MPDAICTSYIAALYDGEHRAADTYKLALYGPAASFSHATTVYTSENEVRGQGYEAGGRALSGFRVAVKDKRAAVHFNGPTWQNATIAARWGLVYNASRGGKAVAVRDFGTTIISSNGPFVVHFSMEGLFDLAGP